ncbi:hypothetical protein RB595_010507 [Gaeumannomyces hyphopodioides]
MAGPAKWAVLIGIDCYSRPGQPPTTRRYNSASDEIPYPNLGGCVNDVLAIEHYLLNTLQVPPQNITKLLAPNPDRGAHRWPLPATWIEPTYDRIVHELRKVSGDAKSGKGSGAKEGDLVYVHFSGHGALATTVFAHLRGCKGARAGMAVSGTADDEDHALVPSDVLYGGRYLRDLEIAVLMQDMVEAGLVVTVVLDCCHSGGAARGGSDGRLDERVRGIKGVYDSHRDPAYGGVPNEATMDRIAFWADKPSWLDEPQGFVVLAACLAQEKALETNDGPHGALTKCLLDVLRLGPLGMSAQAIYEMVFSKVYEGQLGQTPYLVGDGGRFFFNEEVRARVYGHRVINTETASYKALADRCVTLGGGLMHGVRQGSVYAIYSSDCDPKIDPGNALAEVKVVKVMDGVSKATFNNPEEDTPWADIMAGCVAILKSLPVGSHSTVWFDMDAEKRDIFTKRWDAKIADQTWLALADDDTATFRVSIDNSRHFAIDGQLGAVTTIMGSALDPILAEGNDLDQGVLKLVRRLEHLARYKWTKELVNHSVANNRSPALIDVGIDAAPNAREVHGERLEPVSTMKPNDEGLYSVGEKRLFRVTVKNLSEQKVHFVILDCSAEFAVQKVFPMDGPFATLNGAYGEGKHKEREVILGAEIAPELHQAFLGGWRPVDTFKIFASSEAPQLHALELDSLTTVDGRASRGQKIHHKTMDQLRAGFSADPTTLATWQTEDIRVQLTPSML